MISVQHILTVSFFSEQQGTACVNILQPAKEKVIFFTL